MRLSMKRGSAPTPCETIPFGEVEDYTVTLSGPTTPPTVRDFALLNNSNFFGPVSVLPDYSFSCGVQVKNNGPGRLLASEALSIDVYFSTNNTLEATDVELTFGNDFFSALESGQVTNFNPGLFLPANTPLGDGFLIFKIDSKSQFVETDETNNTVIRPIKVVATGKPNLIVPPSSISYITMGNAFAGAYVPSEFAWTNTGPVVVPANPNLTIKKYLSSDAVLGTSDVFLQAYSLTDLIPISGDPLFTKIQMDLLIPTNTPSGNYFIITKVDGDNVIDESNEADNTQSLPIVIGGGSTTTCTANLLQNPGFENNQSSWTGSVGQMEPTGNSGAKALKICAAGAVRQMLPTQAGKKFDLFVAAKKDDLATGVVGIKFLNASFAPVPSNEFYLPINSDIYTQISNTYTAPITTAWVEVSLVKTAGTGCVFADDFCLTESIGNNQVDFSLTNNNLPLTMLPGTVQSFNLNFIATNTNAPGTPNFINIETFLSTDATLSANDISLVSSGMAAGQNSSPVVEFFLSSTTLAGNYFLITKIDPENAVSESNENNNITFIPLTVLSTTGNATCTGNLVKNPGFEQNLTDWGYSQGTITVVNDAHTGTKAARVCGTGLQVQNVSVQAGKIYSLKLWAKITLGGATVAITARFLNAAGQPLLKGETYTNALDWTELTLQNMKAPVGTVYMEINFSATNGGAGDCLLVDDFCLTEINIPSTQVDYLAPIVDSPPIFFKSTGYQIEVDLRFTGIPAANAPEYVVLGLYLSSDNTLSADDYLITTGLAFNPYVSGKQVIGLSIQPEVPNGSYFLLTKVDDFNQFPETNENNNVYAKPVTITDNGSQSGCEIELNPGTVWCYNGGTLNNAADDKYVFTISPTKANGSGHWNALINGQPGYNYNADYNVNEPVSIYDYAINQGPLNIEIKDELPSICTKTFEYQPPLSCSLGADLCASKGLEPWQEWIEKTFISGNTPFTNGKHQYQNTSVVFKVIPGTSQTFGFDAQWSFQTYDEYVRIWVDWNKNGIFEEPSEIVGGGLISKPANAVNATKPFSFPYTIPANFTGATRMRIAMKRGTTAPSPCGDFQYGEVEDYYINASTPSLVTKPDLTVAQLSAVQVGLNLEVTGTISNLTSGVANGSDSYLYISTDNQISANDIANGFFYFSNNGVGSTTSTVSLNISTLSAGTYYLIFKADALNTLDETDETNNTKTIQFTYAGSNSTNKPDLELSFTATPQSPGQWKNTTITLTLKNNGTAATGGVTVDFIKQSEVGTFSKLAYASHTASVNTLFDSWTGIWDIGTIAAGETKTLTYNGFTKVATQIVVFGQVKTQSSTDADSSPNNNSSGIPIEDDEARVVINSNFLAAGNSRQEEVNFDEIVDYQLFPNPAGESVFVKITDSQGITKVSLHNQMGLVEKIQEFSPITNSNNETDGIHEFQLQDVSNGVYFMKIETAGKRTVTKKLVVSRMY
jgi:subtilase family serine protease